jgi:O-antigen/teichoic acid export membrane protein
LHNALYGTAEYIALPLMMLVVTPFLLHRLGLPQFGLWMLAGAAVNSSNLISTGFGDGALKYASMYRSEESGYRFEHTLRVNVTINLILGGIFAVALWFGSPFAVDSVFKVDTLLRSDAVLAFRIGSAILLVRCVESVLTAALRSHERYGTAVQISVCSRASLVLALCVLVWLGHGVVAMMAATLCVVASSVVVQTIVVRMTIARLWPLPSLKMDALSEVFHFGCFSWLQALAGCIFNQADRLLVGALLGTSAVGVYSVCVQAAQPIHGLLAAGLHFLFPHLSARLATTPAGELNRLVRAMFRFNGLAAVLFCVPMVLLSKPILHVWMGAAFASANWPVLSIIALSFGFLSLNVTAHYALLALAHVRLVAVLNLLGGGAMILVMSLLASRLGLTGAAAGRLLYGPITLLMYPRLWKLLSPVTTDPSRGLRRLVVTGTESP